MHAQSLLYRYRMYSLDNHCFAGQHMIKILNCKEVAARLNKSEKTLSTEMVRRPTSLPPWFKLPQSKKPLWLESTVDQFVLDQARKAGALPTPAEVKK